MAIRDTARLNQRIGAAIRKQRVVKAVTQRQLGKALGIAESTLSRYEAGHRTFSAALLWRIAQELGVSPDHLVPHTKENDSMAQTASNTRIIAVANLKGGVGKTTTVLNIAGFAGRLGKRVLAIDTDPQGSLTRVALPDDTPAGSLSEAFARRAQSLDGVRCASRFAGVDLVPATLGLEAVLQTAIPWEGREYVLLDMLTPHLHEYDLILIDCRPGVDLSVTNALTAARWLLVPVECSFLALDGYEHVRALQTRLTQRINPELELLGLLPTRYRSGTAHGQAALEEIAQQAQSSNPPLRFAPIRLAVAAADAPAQGMTLADFAPMSPIGQEYRTVTEQILRFLEKQV